MENFVIDIKIEPLEEGSFLALSEDLPGLLAEGRSYQEALEIAQDVARKIIESYIEHGDPLPENILKQINKTNRFTKFRIPISVAL